MEKTRQTMLMRYGAERATQVPEFLEKVKQTNLLRRGVEWPAQDKEVGLAQARSQVRSIIKTHRKTQEQPVCTASREAKVVDWLNNRLIDFDWRPVTFRFSNGVTYRPDLFLIGGAAWVEIKGYMRPKSLKNSSFQGACGAYRGMG